MAAAYIKSKTGASSLGGLGEEANLAIAKFFKDHRLSSGLSVDQVAKGLNLDQTKTVESYESGTVAIPLEDIFALTNLLNIPPEDVLALIFDITSQQGRS